MPEEMTVKLMVAPGKLHTVQVPKDSTVLQVCGILAQNEPDVQFVQLARDREVRVQNQKFSNVDGFDKDKGYVGSIETTPLQNGQVVLIMTKIKGNGDGVFLVTINDEQYGLDAVQSIGETLSELLNVDTNVVDELTVNGRDADLDDLVGANDNIRFTLLDDDADETETAPAAAAPAPRASGSPVATPRPQPADDDDDLGRVVTIDGKDFAGRLKAIKYVANYCGQEEDTEVLYNVNGKHRKGKVKAICAILDLP